MSQYYRHILIPTVPQYRPNPDLVTTFLEGCVDLGVVAEAPGIQLNVMMNVTPTVHEITNPFTGSLSRFRGPSRKVCDRRVLHSMNELRDIAGDVAEYDIILKSTGIPNHPACDIGYWDKVTHWTRWQESFKADVICHIRSTVVRLSIIETPESLTGFPKDDGAQSRFEDNCSTGDSAGYAVHPERGAIRLPGVGCGTFWISFGFGKWLYPKMDDVSINILSGDVIRLAESTFGLPFTQSCSWG